MPSARSRSARSVRLIQRQGPWLSRYWAWVCRQERIAFGVDAWSPPALRAELAHSRVLLARSPAGRPLGYLAFTEHDRLAEVWTVVVAPSARGQGIGRQLLRMMQWWASQHDQAVELDVRLDNTAARRLYASLQFVEQRRHRHAYQPDGDRSRTGIRLRWVPMGLDLGGDDGAP